MRYKVPSPKGPLFIRIITRQGTLLDGTPVTRYRASNGTIETGGGTEDEAYFSLLEIVSKKQLSLLP